MARLILINGLPGSGKSTIARYHCTQHALALCLDVDVVRGLLGGWRDRPSQAGFLARRLALAMAEVALRDDHDVVVPQFLLRTRFLDELEHLARRVGSPFAEVVLLDPVEVATRRLADRATGAMTETQRDAHALLDADGGLDRVPELHRELLALIEHRPNTIVIQPVPGDVDQTYRDLLAHL